MSYLLLWWGINYGSFCHKVYQHLARKFGSNTIYATTKTLVLSQFLTYHCTPQKSVLSFSVREPYCRCASLCLWSPNPSRTWCVDLSTSYPLPLLACTHVPLASRITIYPIQDVESSEGLAPLRRLLAYQQVLHHHRLVWTYLLVALFLVLITLITCFVLNLRWIALTFTLQLQLQLQLQLHLSLPLPLPLHLHLHLHFNLNLNPTPNLNPKKHGEQREGYIWSYKIKKRQP